VVNCSATRRSLIVFLLFLTLALCWLWPMPARLTSRIPFDAGDPVLVTWILWWNTQAMPFTERWWSPPIFYPLTGALALSEHFFGVALFTTPLQLAGLPAVGAYNVALILSCWLSGFLAFLLGRRLTGSATAGVIAGVAFAFAPYRAGQLSHLHVLTAQWMPLALLAMHAYLEDRRSRWLALFALAWVLQALSNGYFLLFFPVLIAAWLVWFVRWTAEPRPGLMLAGTFALSSLLLVPSLLKYREVHEALGLSRQWSEMLTYSAEPASFLRMAYHLKFYPYVAPKTQEDFLFPGITAVVLTLIAAIAASKATGVRRAVTQRSPLLFYTLATILMWWLALGPALEPASLQTILKPYTLLALLPGFNGLRVPARFVMLGTLTLAVAAALAFRRLERSRPRLGTALAAVIFAGLFVDGWIRAMPLIPPAPRVALPYSPDAIVLELPVDDSVVAVTAMFRSISHGRPLIDGYSGHTPMHLSILASALQRGDPSAILRFAEGRPIVIIVHTRYDDDRALENLIRSLPGVEQHAASSAGPVFLLPAQPRPRVPPTGPHLSPTAVTREADHLVIDLGAPQVVREIRFPVRWHFDELHPRLEVEASLDGTTWTRTWFGWTGGVAISGALENAREVPFRMHFPDVQARYLRIHPAQRWMIRELAIYGPG
jgi:hypothetical protein